MGNIFGKIFRVATFGESHGAAVGCVIDGCPSGIELSEADIQAQLDRRRPGQSTISTLRKESDTCRILSGVYEGKTLGSPICVMVENLDQRPGDYSEIAKLWRPSRSPRGRQKLCARDNRARRGWRGCAQDFGRKRRNTRVGRERACNNNASTVIHADSRGD